MSEGDLTVTNIRDLDDGAVGEFERLMNPSDIDVYIPEEIEKVGEERPLTYGDLVPIVNQISPLACFHPNDYMCSGTGCCGFRGAKVVVLGCGCELAKSLSKCCILCPDAHEECCGKGELITDWLESPCCHTLSLRLADNTFLIQHRETCFRCRICKEHSGMSVEEVKLVEVN